MTIKIRLACSECGAVAGDSEILDDGFEVEVMVRNWPIADQQLCVTCYLYWMQKRGKAPQFGELK